MITKQVIEELYKHYRKKPSGIENLEIGLLFEPEFEQHKIEISEDGKIIINSLDKSLPIHAIDLKNVHGITRFERHLAIVLHSSILFLNKENEGVSVHVKQAPTNFWQKLLWWFTRR